MSTTISPNMSLPIPVVSQQPGPDYASNINQCLTTLDAHDHATGSGVPITPDGINITSDLAFNNNNATGLRTTRYQAQASTLGSAAADVRCLYFSGVDLYANDGSGNVIRLTQSGGIAAASGSIANLTSPASASYVSAQGRFVWQSDTNIAADMDFKSAIFRNSGASAFGMTVQSPTLGANQTITLPAAPGSTQFLAMDSSGVITPYISVAKASVISGRADANVTSLTSICSLTISIPVPNAHIALSLQPFSVIDESYLQASGGSNGYMIYALQRNGSTIWTTSTLFGVGSDARRVGLGQYAEDVVSTAGSYTYTMVLNSNNGVTTATTFNLCLRATRI